MKKTLFLLALILPAALAVLAAAPASAATMSVVSDTNVQVVGVYNKATSSTAFVDESSTPFSAVLAAEPAPYSTVYTVGASNSTWDTGTGLYFQNNAPTANWIWDTQKAEDPANYAADNPLYDPDASTHGRVVKFQKSFTVNGIPQDSNLHIAADNAYEVWVNGHNLGRSATAGGAGWELTNLHQVYVNTAGWTTVGNITVPAADLINGNNTITILAGNEYYGTDDGNSPTPAYTANPYEQYNPGALIFAMNVNYTPVSPLEVTKTAETSFTRTYSWTIDKSADVSTLTLAPGETYGVNYSVTVSATPTDNYAVDGSIIIHNPNTVDATITGVTDEMTGGITADVSCSGVTEFPYTLAAGSDLDCTYSASLSDGTERTNTATVTTSGDVPGGSGTADVTFGNPVVTDGSVSVMDTFGGALGTVDATSGSHTFGYAHAVGPYPNPGTYTVDNTATFTTNDTHTTGDSSWTVDINVPQTGCTLTQGYWKTHSSFGPAPSDSTWNLWPGGPSATFYSSGTSTIGVLNTAPKGGNAYYTLAHQYIAAKLNILNGASAPSSVQAKIADAEALFGNALNTPAYIGGLKGNNTLRQRFLNDASVLGNYNEGLIGPGHCSEQAWQYVDTVDVPANSESGVASHIALANGVTYKLVAGGTFFAGDYIKADAKYSLRDMTEIWSDSSGWTDSVQNYLSYGPTLLDLQVNGSSPNWGAYNPLHVYETLVTGTGSPINLKIYDIYYPNDIGSLTVNIYRQL